MKPGEYLITDVGTIAILPLMTSASVVDIYVARDLETDPKDLVLFFVEQFVPLDDDAIHLTGRDIDTQFQVAPISKVGSHANDSTGRQ